MKLPTLSTEDIEKLDKVLAFLKENKQGYINISTYCSQNFGDNHQLETLFSDCLIESGLTTPQNDYIWSQIITQEGLAFDSFKNEYSRQSKEKKKETSKKTLESHNLKLSLVAKYIGGAYITSDILTLILSKGKFGMFSYFINLISK